MLSNAVQSVSSLIGFDLDVVDPDADSSKKADGASTNNGLYVQERQQVWGTKQFQQYIGADVTNLLSVPVFIMEPFTILQKAAEIMEYTDLLDKADSTADMYERFALVAAYCVSPFGAAERAWKPFNPILGETFECDGINGVKYLAEQVSHHPPVCAAHAQNAHFFYDLVSAPTTKFLGNSLEVYPYGRTRITLRSSGEVFSLVPPNAKVHNIVLGRTWVDAAGTMSIQCPTTGCYCTLEFKPCGWFSYGRYEFKGYVYDKDGVPRILVSGLWNAHVDTVPCDGQGNALPGEEVKRLWTCTPKPEDYYSFTTYAHKLNSSANIPLPLPSDSRRRSDRSKLAAGEMLAAGADKVKLEEMQRTERKERERLGDSWKPRWFNSVASPELIKGELDTEKVPFWEFNGEWLKVPRTEMSDEEGLSVNGKGFCPWQYPHLHAQAAASQ